MNGGFKASRSSLASYALAATLLLPPFGCAADGGERDAAVDDSQDSDGGEPGVDDAGDNHGGEPGADDSGSNDGPDAAVDDQPDSAGEVPSPSDGGGFGEASAREVEDADHSDVMPCNGYTQMRTGMNYGEYSLYAIRITEGLETDSVPTSKTPSVVVPLRMSKTSERGLWKSFMTVIAPDTSPSLEGVTIVPV